MNEDQYILLIYKQLKGELSAAESEQLDNWLAADEDHRHIQEQVARDWGQSAHYTADTVIDVKGDFEKLRTRMQAYNTAEAPKVRQLPARGSWMSWAAAIALLIAAGWWWMNQGAEEALQLAKTGEGEKTEVLLADGTKVWLNENSQLEYQAQFSAIERMVYLKGEAYFEVQSNPEVPFKIHSSTAAVEVLGTAFNYRDYADEQQVNVLVKEGKVSLQPLNSKKAIILTKGEKGVFDKEQKELRKLPARTMNDLSWQSGVMEFRNTPLEVALKDIEQRFKVKVSIVSRPMNACPLTGRFPNATAQSVLEDIARVFQMKLEGNPTDGYTLSDGICS